MKRWGILGGALVLSFAVAACSADTTDTTAANRDQAVGTAGNTNANTTADREFVQKQLAMGQHEIQLGQLAQQKGSHAEVKRFGEMMVRDHRMAGDELKQISSKLATGTSGSAADAADDVRDDHKDAMEDLNGVTGRDFDRKYIDQMIDDHEKAVNDLERISGNGGTELRQWAAKTLPKVQQHLEQARTIKETLDQAGNK